MQNVVSLQPKAPKKDFKKFLDLSGKFVRFQGKLQSPWRHDEDRK